eukprot:382180-Rhodomonas_salina.3
MPHPDWRGEGQDGLSRLVDAWQVSCSSSLRVCYAMCASDMSASSRNIAILAFREGTGSRLPTHLLCDTRMPYAISGAGILSDAEGSIGLRACYAMSGTDIAYAAPYHRESLHR